MKLAAFITRNMEPILSAWEMFARALPAGESMDVTALRDHAQQILEAVCKDIATEQSRDQEIAKSNGLAMPINADETAAQTHALMRARGGFNINQMASEYRALRASVLRLWTDECAPTVPDLLEMIRFNEAIDQALAESITFFSAEVERARNLLLGVLGHDMRTPLTSIQMTAQYLRKLNAGDAVSVAAGRLIRSGALIKGLLDDLTEFNRTQLGLGISISVAETDLDRAFEDLIQQVRDAHPAGTIVLECDGDLRCTCDARRLQQVLSNLVVNALRYGAPDQPVNVTLTGLSTEIVIRVDNVGRTIPEATLAQLFDPLRRGDDRPAEEGSLGLGLYICREIAQAHAGSIAAKSNNSLTSFTVRIPRHCRNNRGLSV